MIRIVVHNKNIHRHDGRTDRAETHVTDPERAKNMLAGIVGIRLLYRDLSVA